MFRQMAPSTVWPSKLVLSKALLRLPSASLAVTRTRYCPAGSDKAGLELDWSWPAPFHPQGKPLSYRVQVARAVAGKEAFAADTLLPQPAPVSGRTQLNVGALPAGQYLVRVTASDADGNSTNAFDRSYFDGKVVDGAACLTMPGAKPC